MQKHLEQRISVTLAAREHADTFEDVVTREQEAAQQATQFGLRGRARLLAQVFQDARLWIEFLVLVLCEVVEVDVVAELEFSGGQRLGVGQQLDQGGLPGSVYADERNPVATLDHEINVVEDVVV